MRRTICCGTDSLSSKLVVIKGNDRGGAVVLIAAAVWASSQVRDPLALLGT